MTKREAYKIVLEDLQQVSLFCGKYDAKNGNSDYMSGIATVMESIAYMALGEDVDTFVEKFYNNIALSKGAVE